ncbi:hypothetical protein Vadar_008576 [Vaccinium darrowii]|uniref:Uncharacterized protein n=1 Tax=Vaccinium darrowii TaxID=229202 RepID=A0ACB7YEL7_9ERIC|nr:hypothetical protein Vadar_008576 [Vaccinium darrowii]
MPRTVVVGTLTKARTTQSTIGLLVTQAEHSLEVAEATRKKASVENCSIVRRFGREVMGQTQNHANPLAQQNSNNSLAQRKLKDSMALHNSSMRSRQLMNPIHEVQIFSSRPVGIRSKIPNESSNLKRQRQRRNRAPKKVEQKSVAANVTVAIEKALGEYNDDFESSTESTTESLVESELNSCEVESPVTRSMAKSKELVGGVKRDGFVLLYSSSSSSGESSSSTKNEPISVTKAVSVMMVDVNDEEQNPTSSNMNSMLMAMIDDIGKKQVKKAKEKDDEGFQMITKPYPAWVDIVPFPPGFSQPDFKMFGSAFTWYSNLPEGSIPSWDLMVKEFLRQFCNTQRRVGVLELIETKQHDNEPVTDFIARWQALTFACPQKFTQLELIRMSLNNFRHELSTTLMAQTFEDFNDLCTKAHDMELHLSKRRRPRVVDRLETSMTATVETKKGGPIVVGA